MDIRMTFSPEKSNDKADVYYVRVQELPPGQLRVRRSDDTEGRRTFPCGAEAAGSIRKGFFGTKSFGLRRYDSV